MKYQVKSTFRFTLFIAFSIIIAVSGLNILFGTTPEVSGSSEPSYRTIEVCYGDTLWTIARDYMPKDMDVREAVYELRELNDMTATDQLTAGQTIRIPEL